MSNRTTYLGLGAVIILGLSTALFSIFVLNALISDESEVEEEIMQSLQVTEVIIAQSPQPTVASQRTVPATNTRAIPTAVVVEHTPTATLIDEFSVIESRQSRANPNDLIEGRFIVHKVEEGENLYQIAAAYGLSLESLLSANNLNDPRVIYAGQLLQIPVPDGAALSQLRATEIPSASVTPELSLATGTALGEPTATMTAEEQPPSPTTIPPQDTQTPPPPTTTLAPGTPTPIPDPIYTVNGVSKDQIIIMSEDVKERAREIFATGQQLGRNPRAFSKVGDSTIENPHFLARFDSSPYNLGPYWYLQPTIDYFAGSFGRQGYAVRRGFHSWTVTDPLWADKEACEPNESPIACEIRLHNPAILLVRLGSNDKGVPAGFNQNVRLVVEYAISQGVIPVIGTKADRFEGEDNINNILLRQIAADYRLPLWDFDLIAGTLPGRGLDTDDVHLTFYYAHDYTSPVAYQRGHSVHNLTALMVLEQIRNEVIQAGG